MKKTGKSLKKKILTAVIVIFSVMVALDIIVANIIINLALVNAVDSDMNVAPAPIVTGEARKIIADNKRISDEETNIWHKNIFSEKISVMSDEGFELFGELFENAVSSHYWSICLHGYVGSHKDMLPFAKFYYEQGYNVITPDLRVHGDSEGKFIGMGWTDRRDLFHWIKYITDRDPNAKIILHGVSMGAAAVMMAIGEPDISVNVVAAVEDCGYSSVWDVFSDEAKNVFRIPDFPILYTASLFTKLRAGYSFKEASALKQIKKTDIPVLFIHGSADNFVNSQMVYKLYEACPTKKSMYIAEGAGHVEAFYLDMERYKE